MSEIPAFSFSSRRSPVFSSHGMAAASQPLAVAAGLKILSAGGNAADAAVAMAATLAVTEPCSTGLGGDAFVLHYDATTRSVTGLNGSGRAPAALSLELLQKKNLQHIPASSALAVTVPGACGAWCDLLQLHGSMPLVKVLTPAIGLAYDGFTPGPVTANLWQQEADKLRNTPHGAELLLPNGKAPGPKDRMFNANLAHVLEHIAKGGKNAFYAGWPAERISRAVQAAGGVLTEADLAAHGSLVADTPSPVSTVFCGKRIFECAPNGQGLAALIACNVLTVLRARGHYQGAPLSCERVHAGIEALRLGFATARSWVADPEHTRLPLDTLLSLEHAEKLAALFSPKQAMPQGFGAPLPSSDTVYFCVVDADGNACSMVNSNYMGFGTGIVPQGCGFSLQNRGHNFISRPGHPNSLEPGKRPYHTIIPAMALYEAPDGEEHAMLYAPFGVMGGFMQPQGHVQVLEHLLVHGMDPQAALDKPRFCITGDLQGQTAPESELVIALEEGMPTHLAAALQALGHNTSWVTGHDRALFGRGQIIRKDPATQILCAGSDGRADGCAMGMV